jgi:small subunit ribosomal protein S3Ae
MFVTRNFTKTPVNVTQGKTYSHESIKGRIFEISVGDLNPGCKTAYQKVQLIVDDASEITNKECATNFHGMSTTKDHLCSLIRKWHTLIETFVDVKTTDGFVLRFFIVAFTLKSKNQLKATSYAQRSQIKLIRRKMNEVVTKEVNKSTLKELVSKLYLMLNKFRTSETIPAEIEKQCKKVFPINNCIIRKVKTVKRPRFDSK